jgi:hypothetical protein
MAPHREIAPRRRPNVTVVRADRAAAGGQPYGAPAKPTAADLGVDLAALDWQRSGDQAGAFEVAFVAARGGGELGDHDSAGGQAVDWVLLRVAGDPDGRVLVYDRTEWMCFIDGAGRGEFDLACELVLVLAHPSGREKGVPGGGSDREWPGTSPLVFAAGRKVRPGVGHTS